MKLWLKFTSLFRRKTLDADMAEEMRLHLEQRIQESIADGMSPEEARFATLRKFGGVDQVKEIAREQRSFTWLEHVFGDLKYAVRGMANDRGFTLLAALILALGIGVNTALFSVIHGVLLNPYPYAKPNEIWKPQLLAVNKGGGVSGPRIADYLALADLPAVAQAMAANPQQATLAGGINPEVIRTVHMSATAFDFLGVAPVAGRTIGAGDYQANGEPQPVAVLSFKLWHRLFNGDRNAIGQTMTLNDTPHTVIGVMPPRFNWYTSDGLWLPQATTPAQQGTNVVLRLRPGVSKEIAEQQINAYFRHVHKETPKRFPTDGFAVRLDNYLDASGSSAQVRASLHLLLFAVGFLLLIACTNVANLQLVRGATRSREFAIRLALGASRGRLVRQLLTESLGLSLLGGALGALLALWLTQLIVFLLPSAYVPSEARMELNGPALLFCAGLSVLTGLVFGLLPAVQCTRPDLNDALKTGGHAAAGDGRSGRTRNGFVVTQIALSTLLLVGATLTIRGFVQFTAFDPGFHPERTLMLRVPLTPLRYRTAAQRNTFTQELMERIGRLPGVVSVAAGTLPGMEGTMTYAIPGQHVPEGARITGNAMSADYFATLGVPLRAGRNLTEQEIAFGEPVALINESAAKLWADGASPLGQTIQMQIPPPLRPGPHPPVTANGRNVTIVGIVGNIRENGLPTEAKPGVFLPYTLRGGNQRLLVVRTQGEPLSLLNAVRVELRALDPDQPLDHPVTWEELVATETAVPRFNMALFSGLAAVALGLAVAGIYSVLSYNVTQRTREIGVRIALGAGHAEILRLVLAGGGRLVGFGLLLGLGISVPLASFARSKLFGLGGLDPLTVGTAALVIGAAALTACYLPARRAAKVDPVIALRSE